MQIFGFFLAGCAAGAVTIGFGFMLCELCGIAVDIASWWTGFLSAIFAILLLIVWGNRNAR